MRPHTVLSIAAVLIALLAAGVQTMRQTTGDGSPAIARVVAFDVGQGDAILLDGPGDGAEIVVDGGPSAEFARTLRRTLGRDRTLDLLVLTHPHADHLVGFLSVFDAFEVRRVLLTGTVHTTREYEQFLTLLRDREIPTTVAVAGQTYDIGAFHLELLHPFTDLTGVRPENLNDSSIVAMLTVGDRRMLLTGDAETSVETELLKRYCPDRGTGASGLSQALTVVETGDRPRATCAALRADILKVGHHGSQDASSPPFLDVVVPQHAIISVGARNDYGHPHRRALKRLERTAARIWRTDRQGEVTVTFGPDGVAVSSER